MQPHPDTRHALHSSPLGTIYLAGNDHALTGAWVAGQAHFATSDELGKRINLTDHPILYQAAQELDEYFAGQRTVFEVPLQPQGTDFQLAVWDALTQIPHGYTTTYGEISKIVGPHAPARAVGQAVGRNKLTIFIPCHRVIAADGKIAGYASGTDNKKFLLNLEQPTTAAESRGHLF